MALTQPPHPDQIQAIVDAMEKMWQEKKRRRKIRALATVYRSHGMRPVSALHNARAHIDNDRIPMFCREDYRACVTNAVSKIRS